MKQGIAVCILASLLIISTSLFGCNEPNANSADVLATSQVTDDPIVTALPTAAITAIVTEAPTQEPTASPEPVPPVYDIYELLDGPLSYSTDDITDLCDRTFALKKEYFLEEAPTEIVREKDGGEEYAVYDTDEGYRVYVFFKQLGDPDRLYGVGFPVIIKELHSYSDFSSLKIGDPIDAVALIDPVAELQRVKAANCPVANVVEYYHNRAALWRRPVSTFHYLSDGVLKIEYDMGDDRTLYIINMVYSEDYKLVSGDPEKDKGSPYCMTGIEVDYYIYPQDLPPQE